MPKSLIMNKIYFHLGQIVLISLAILYSCNVSVQKSNNNMKTIQVNDWRLLSEKNIFFGHQSIGYNIIEGIYDLQKSNNLNTLQIIETRKKEDFKNPQLLHACVGNNMDPKSKIDDFVGVLMESNLGDSLDIAFMKLCYVDFNKNTNIKELFDYYISSMNDLKEKYPKLRIIHSTVPLTVNPKGLKGLIKAILRRDNNKFRHLYNELLRKHYTEDELFDIAKIEATFSDGSINTNKNGVPCLINEYSSDGGHLNQQGRELLAYYLINKLLVN